MSITALPLTAGWTQESADADNATATATKAATGAVQHKALGLYADYSAAPTAGWKTITLKRGTTTIATFRHDFASHGAFSLTLPVALSAGYTEALSAELQASGTLGVLGRVKIFGITN
jgi:hypothetical protein